jgi:hypothetical protein
MRPVVRGAAGRRAITRQLRSVSVRKIKSYKKKHCQERPGQLYDNRERPGEASDEGGRWRRQGQGQREQEQ